VRSVRCWPRCAYDLTIAAASGQDEMLELPERRATGLPRDAQT